MPAREAPATAVVRQLREAARANPLSDVELDRAIRRVKGGGIP